MTIEWRNKASAGACCVHNEYRDSEGGGRPGALQVAVGWNKVELSSNVALRLVASVARVA